MLMGHSVGDYHLKREVGSGPASVVFLAGQPGTSRQAAFKIILPVSWDRSVVNRLLVAAERVSGFRHPNVVSVLDSGRLEGISFIVEEYVRGRTLRAVLAKRGALSAQQALHVTRQCLAAVIAAHRDGITHGDIKPGNIFILPDDDVKVADFGFALRLEDDLGVKGLTGTFPYLAPEQLEGHRADEQTDVYALGVVFFEMLSGGAPFEAKSARELYLKQFSDKAPALESARPELPPSLCRLVGRMLIREREERFMTAQRALSALGAVSRDIKSETSPGRKAMLSSMAGTRSGTYEEIVVCPVCGYGFRARSKPDMKCPYKDCGHQWRIHGDRDAEVFSTSHRRPHARLVAISGADKGRVFKVRGNGTTIGSSKDCGITLSDERISPLHARIVKEGARYRLVCPEEGRDVRLNGRQVRAALLEIDDTLVIGESVLQFRMHYAAPTAYERSRDEMLKTRHQRKSKVYIRGEVVNRVVLGANEMIMGREDKCDVVLKSPFVSRRHVWIVPVQDGYLVRDANSTTGTFVNGEHISEHNLRIGDEVQVGSFLFRFTGSALERNMP